MTQAENSKKASEKAKVLEAAKLAYNAVMAEHLGQVTGDTIAGWVVNQMKEDGETVVTKTTTEGRITSITINGKTTEAITVATDGENQTKTLTVAYGNGTSQAGSTYYVLAKDVYYILTVNLAGVSLSENYLTQEELDAIEGNATVDDTVTIEPETNSYSQVTLQGTTLTITGGNATTSPVAIKLKSTNGGAEATLTITVETPPDNNTATPGVIVTGSNKVYTKNGTAKIPVGYAIVPGLDDVSEGLVISSVANDTNNTGNQFVWIPVTEDTTYARNRSYYNTSVSAKAIDDDNYLPDGVTKTEERLVKDAGGFYIARYEAGKEGTATLVSKKRATVWTNIKPTDSTNNNGAKEVSKGFVNNNYVKSGLITGIQWDMAMSFISSKTRKDGTGKDYVVTKASSTRHKGGSVAIAGNNEADKVCNIYDLEGNAYEYIAERSDYHTNYPYVFRGGDRYTSGSASYRFYRDGLADSNCSFRFALYVM